MNTELYILFICLGMIGYLVIPFCLFSFLRNNKETYPILYHWVFIEDKPFSLRKFIGLGNFILLGILIAITPILNMFVTILMFMGFSERVIVYSLKLIERLSVNE